MTWTGWLSVRARSALSLCASWPLADFGRFDCTLDGVSPLPVNPDGSAARAGMADAAITAPTAKTPRKRRIRTPLLLHRPGWVADCSPSIASRPVGLGIRKGRQTTERSHPILVAAFSAGQGF